jgi:hypothetical protein
MKDLSEVASISGKGGLYKVLKPGRTGVILESLDEKKIRLVTNPNHKVSILAEISVYTNTEEGAVPLEDLFKRIYKEFGDDPGVDSKSSNEEFMSFLEYILPEYDTTRVYPSDVKKLVNWYGILLREAPELLKQDKKQDEKKKSSSEDTNEKNKKADVTNITEGEKKKGNKSKTHTGEKKSNPKKK